MNWLDLVLIAVIAVPAWVGMRTGIVGAAIVFVGVVIGWQLAGQLADDAGGLAGESLSADKWITALAYVLIVGAAVFVANFVSKLVKPLVSAATLGLGGLADKLGGLVLGLMVGIAITGVLVAALSRITYSFDLPDEGVAGMLAGSVPRATETWETVESTLAGSAIVRIYVDAVDALPDGALGFLPRDIEASLHLLNELSG